MKPLKTNPRFKALIPPISNEEFENLTENILTLGRCRESIKTWHGIIVDGHNRYTICQQHCIPFTIKKLRFSSKKDAELWIIQNQLGRRNLTNATRIKLVLHKEGLLREKAKENRSGIKESPVNTRKILAKEANVSEQTLQRYMTIRELGSPELLEAVDKGEKKIGTAYRMVQVTQRHVTYDRELCDINHHPITTRNALANIDKIERLCILLDRNTAMYDEDEIGRIQKRVAEQLKTTRGLCARFTLV
ncbi:MAG: hypothetical protein FWC73_09910 [Defluviitaleaceae bacterium]|nr:hypothetical protein [Defluviitaleaceae bacterium]